jgi:hypothetical protein
MQPDKQMARLRRRPYNCVALTVTEFASEKRRLGRRTPKALRGDVRGNANIKGHF